MLHGCPVAAVISLYFSDLLRQVAISNLESTNFPQLFEQFCHMLIILGKCRDNSIGAEKGNISRLVDETTHERDVISEVVGALFRHCSQATQFMRRVLVKSLMVMDGICSTRF